MKSDYIEKRLLGSALTPKHAEQKQKEKEFGGQAQASKAGKRKGGDIDFIPYKKWKMHVRPSQGWAVTRAFCC